jgi:hypothetical protein
MLYAAEAYNGFGYFQKGVNDPYDWAGSDLYESGKFVSDGQYDANFIDPQLGVAVLLKRLAMADASVAARISPPPAPQPPATRATVDMLATIVAALRAAADTIEKAAAK